MPETLLSMAISLVESVVRKAALTAANEMSLLMGVRTHVWFIRDELNSMHAFLVVAESIKKKDMLLKVWVEQVRDMSYDIEDCLDEFMVYVGSQSLVQQLMKLKDRHEIAIQIRTLMSRVEQVSSRNTRYSLIDKKQISSAIDERDAILEDIRNHSASNIDEAELVGFSKPKQELIKLIDAHAMNGPARVVCVVGMGGLGKTTITRKVYESIDDFSCCAWVTVSQSFIRKDLLKAMIKGFFGDEVLDNLTRGKVVLEEDLAKYLRKGLSEKRYFVVLDDLWNIDDWKWIKMMAFPSSNSKGSQIIMTTRDVGLAEECTSESLIYHLQPLQTDDAINLLLRKTRKRKEDMENNENMRSIVPKIVKKCGCLPLAILTIGGMLATKKVTKWASIYNQLPSELESNPSLEAIKRIVTMSYNYLPSHLKPCFLYLSIFPEDFEIERRRLVERWIAEGFISARGGIHIEDVGTSYFNELINRSMIQPSRVNIKGIVKSCRVHDIMRDTMVSIAKGENFVYLVGDSVTSVVEEKFRHVAYHGINCQNIYIGWRHDRSLTMFGEKPMEPSHSVCAPDLRMLRALDLEDAHFMITPKDTSNIGLLHHLKYVSFRGAKQNSHIFKLPRSIGNLQGLQTLDTRGTCIAMLTTEISKLRSLRSLRCIKREFYTYSVSDDPKGCLPPLVPPSTRAHIINELHMAWYSPWSRSEGVRVPRGINNLKELQILEAVDVKQTSGKAIEELGELTQLRKLRAVRGGASEKKCKIFCAAIEKLSSLYSLGLYDYHCGSVETFDWLHSVSSPPSLLRSLKLLGKKMPDWVGSLMHLVKLHLMWSELKEGDKNIEILGALPNLMLLHLDNDAYVGEKLVLGGAFPDLRKLDISLLFQLREVTFEEGTSPLMERMHIRSCKLEGINGIKQLPKLKEISIGYRCKVAKLSVLQGEVDAHPNHPVLRLDESSILRSATGESSRTAVTPSMNDSSEDDI